MKTYDKAYNSSSMCSFAKAMPLSHIRLHSLKSLRRRWSVAFSLYWCNVVNTVEEANKFEFVDIGDSSLAAMFVSSDPLTLLTQCSCNLSIYLSMRPSGVCVCVCVCLCVCVCVSVCVWEGGAMEWVCVGEREREGGPVPLFP